MVLWAAGADRIENENGIASRIVGVADALVHGIIESIRAPPILAFTLIG
jgi:hypothetical protein